MAKIGSGIMISLDLSLSHKNMVVVIVDDKGTPTRARGIGTPEVYSG
jgi:hypothetical protein